MSLETVKIEELLSDLYGAVKELEGYELTHTFHPVPGAKLFNYTDWGRLKLAVQVVVDAINTLTHDEMSTKRLVDAIHAHERVLHSLGDRQNRPHFRSNLTAGEVVEAERLVIYLDGVCRRSPGRVYESCGCLTNDAGAHRVGCPDHPQGVRGD